MISNLMKKVLMVCAMCLHHKGHIDYSAVYFWLAFQVFTVLSRDVSTDIRGTCINCGLSQKNSNIQSETMRYVCMFNVDI